MQARRNHTLKVIKGAKPATPGRTVPRRVVSRRLPTPVEPLEELLRRIEGEPEEDLPDLDEPAASDEPARRAGGVAPREEPADGDRRRGRRPLVALLVVVLVATVAVAGMTGHRWYVEQATQQARQEAVAAAKQAAVNFVSVSAGSVDRDMQRITAGATGDFREEFTRGQSQVRTAVVENKVDSRGAVLRAGLVSGDRRRAVVLVAVDATVRNVKSPEGRPSHYRIQMDMVHDRDSGRWLVSRLQFVG
ncbi:Mce-associated membrane protein [Micromonospora coxensis]|uniref:Mce-associated membrane protein n=2 Tax=Micromonospora coxensis TaxID=356852 RepID=A0A1C5H3B4_9ACTN|nr:Mce-associated membrane protein [Micromonospora coxensis]